MPTECNPGLFDFGSVEGRRVVAGFDGGRVTSDAGALLLGATDRAIRLIDRFAGCFSDGRSAKDVEHAVATLVGQRVFGIALGYEDLIDHDQLRHDPVLATLAGKLAARRPRCAPLAGKSTLNRLEHGTEGYTRYHKIGHDGDAVAMLFVELFLDAHRRPPKQITLDLDATDDPLHGHQEGRFFYGYYDCYCYLPLYVFCGRHLLAAELRRSNINASAGALDEVARIVAHIRRRWPKGRILLRANSAFAREELMAWCERSRVDYVFGLARNDRLVAAIAAEMAEASAECRATGRAARRFQGLAVVDAGQLDPAAPGDRQGGSAAAGRQSALYRHFARARRGRSPLSLRAALLRPWRHGEPDQGVPARPICRSDVCEINAGQSIAAVVRLDGLRAHLRTAPARPRPYPVRPGHLRHNSPAAAENRCLGPHQHPPHQGGDGLGLPPSARIRPRPRPPQQHWPITTRRSRPTYSRSAPLDGGGALLMPAPQLNTARPTSLPPQPQSKRPKNRTATYPREKCGLAAGAKVASLADSGASASMWACQTRARVLMRRRC